MATATLLPPPRSVFYDSCGNPLAGGYVNTFVPGGTTQKTTWQDAAETTPNSNPIVLDSAGSALIYGSGSYQLAVTDAQGNAVPAYSGLTVDTFSPVAFVEQAIISVANIAALRAATTATYSNTQMYVAGYYAGSDGGEGVFWLDTSDTTGSDNGGTIIVDASARRWYRATGGGAWSVKWFGAKIDGTTNDQAACSACSTALIAKGGGKISIPAGNMLLGSTWQIAGTSIWLEGAGDEATIIVNGTTNKAAVQFGDGTNTYNRCACTSMAFAQASGVTAVSGNSGLVLSLQTNFNLRVVQIFPFPAALYQGMIFENVTQWVMDSIGVQGCLSTGISMSFCSDTYMNNCRSDANGVNGWSILDSTGYANACSGYNNTGSAWGLSSAGTNANRNWFFVNCVGDTSGSYNWSINQLTDSYFVQTWGSTQQSTGVNTVACGFFLAGADVDSLTFTECVAEYNNSHGMNIEQASNIKINGGQFGASGYANGRSGSGSGINVYAGLTGIYISDVQCNGNASFGLDVDGPTGLVVNGGNMQGNTSGAVSGASNATRVAGVVGFNPALNTVGAPTIPASGTVITNPTGVDCNVYINGGTSVVVFVGGTAVLNSSPASVYVPAGATIKLTYTAAPTWVWMGQ